MVIQQGLLRMLVVQRLLESPSSGYQLVKTIHERTGWKPSYGSIYPLLEKMQQEKLIVVKAEGRSKNYSLTAQGKKEFDDQREQRVQAFTQVAERIRVLECLGDEGEHERLDEVLEILKRGEIPFQEVPEAIKMKQEMFRLLREGKIKTKRKEIGAVIARATKELQKL